MIEMGHRQSKIHFLASGVPASYFGMVLGLAGLGSVWRAAHRVWGVSAIWGEGLMLLAGVVWAVFIVGYGARWIFARTEALAEVGHPVQCCFIGLIGVSTSLVAIVISPYSLAAAKVLFIAGAFYTVAFALWRTGLLWRGERDQAATTPVLYLPSVAGAFVTANAAATLGHPDWAQLAFGAGLFSWLAIESVLLHRLYTATALPPAMRPLLGIQLAPPAVGAVAYLSITGGVPDLVSRALVGYAVLQALLLIRMLPWIMQQPFALSYWAFTFGATALAGAPLRMIERGETGAVSTLAPYLFVAANLTVGLVAAGTLRLLAQSLWSRETTNSESPHAT